MSMKVKLIGMFKIIIATSFLELEYQIKKQEAKLGRLINELLVNAAVVLGTFVNCSNGKSEGNKKDKLSVHSSAGHLKNIPMNSFSLTVVDECSQAKEASIWVLEPRTDKLVLAGDYHQLPPIVQNRVSIEVSKSLMAND